MKIEVKSNHSDVWYDVDTDEKTCSCTGWQYRGDCRHLDSEKSPIWREVPE